MRHGWLAVLVLTAHLPPAAEAASFPPSLRFRSLSGAFVTVHYPQGLEDPARETLALATEILQAHEARYGVRVGRVQIVLADTTDESNGFATPFPYPLVHIQMVAPDGSDDFGNHDGWLRLVLAHTYREYLVRGGVRFARVRGNHPLRIAARHEISELRLDFRRSPHFGKITGWQWAKGLTMHLIGECRVNRYRQPFF
jgi:hypothetical protein